MLSDTNQVESLQQKFLSCEQIFIPKNIMTISAQSKNVNEEHAKYYNILFYENAYKRVVMWHLSKSQNVVFYE